MLTYCRFSNTVRHAARNTVVFGICVSACFWGAAWAISTTPDTDDENVNNTPDKALNLGNLGIWTGMSYNTLQTSGEVGFILPDKKFDTRDYYKFRVVRDELLVRFRLNETPNFHAYLRLYDSSGKPKRESIGAANEDFTEKLDSGEYFIEVITNLNITFPVQYTLTLNGTYDAPGDTADNSIDNARVLGSTHRKKPSDGYTQKLEDHVGSRDSVDHYRVWIPRGEKGHFEVIPIPMSDGKWLSATVIDDIERRTMFSLPGDPTVVPGPWHKEFVLDPGYYILKIESSTAAPPALRYKLNMLSDGSIYPRPERKDAPTLAMLDVGTSSINGSYRNSRFTTRPTDTAAYDPLISHHPYVIREWTGIETPESFIKFTLNSTAQISAEISHLMDSVVISIEDSNGNERGLALPEGISIVPKFLPHQLMNLTLEKGLYYIRVRHTPLSNLPGTPYQLRLTSSYK